MNKKKLLNDLFYAYYEARRNKRNTINQLEFEFNLERNLIKLYDKWKIKWEFDIIWVNGSKVFIWETKTKLKKEHVDKLIDKQIPTFRKYDRRHAWMKVFWVVWARVVPEKVKQYAKKRWLYIVKEYNNWNARILKESLKTVKSL